MSAVYGPSQRPAAIDDLVRIRPGKIGLGVAVAVAYYMTAWLSLGLRLEPDGVAVFWPAAGISSGVLIAFGPQARWPVAVGVMAATIPANLLGDRNLPASISFALCNAAEPLITAGLIYRYFGMSFHLGRLRAILGLLAAAVLGTAISGHRWRCRL
jgi:integral membrane sensor domain MASE1